MKTLTSWFIPSPPNSLLEFTKNCPRGYGITNKEQSDNFTKGFNLWEDRYGSGLSRSTNRGKVFSDLLRTRSMIRNALPNMFSYLDYPEISKTTNALEGYFGRLKQKYRVHRGLAPQKRKIYFRWYFYLKPI